MSADLPLFWLEASRSLGETLFAAAALCPSVSKAVCALERPGPLAVCRLELRSRDPQGKTARAEIASSGLRFSTGALSPEEERAFSLFALGAEALLGERLAELSAWAESCGLSPLSLGSTPRLDESGLFGPERSSASALGAIELAAERCADFPEPLRLALLAAASLRSYPSEDLSCAAGLLRGEIEGLRLGAECSSSCARKPRLGL